MRNSGTGAHVLLIDDDVELSAMLRQYLETEGFRVSVDPSGRDAASAVSAGGYHAVILDVMLPGPSGIEILRRIRSKSAIPVLMLTAKGDGADRVIGLELGADDYVAKPYYPPELVARVRALLRRRADAQSAPHGQDALAFGDLSVSVAARRARWRDDALILTASEFNLLVALLRSGDDVATKDDLSLQVLGRPREPYDRSVDVHASNLRQKLAVTTAGQIDVETVRAIGFRLRARA